MKGIFYITLAFMVIIPAFCACQDKQTCSEVLYPKKIYKDSGKFEVHFDSLMVIDNLLPVMLEDEETGTKGLACRIRIENKTMLTVHVKMKNEYGNMEPVGYIKSNDKGELILISGKVEIYASTEGQSLEWSWQQHCDRDDPYVIILSEETRKKK